MTERLIDMATDPLGRGRPFTFTTESRRELAELIRKHGARRASELAPVSISVPTLLKIAQEFGIPLQKGRRRLLAESRRELAELVRKYGAQRASKLAPVPISAPTLIKIAREFGISVQRGRRPKPIKSEAVPSQIVMVPSSDADLAA